MSLRWALGISLLLHAIVLAVGPFADREAAPPADDDGPVSLPRPRLDARLARPPAVRPPLQAAPREASTARPRRPAERTPPAPRLSSPAGTAPALPPTARQPTDMDRFLEELVTQPPPPSPPPPRGRELAAQALAAARQMRSEPRFDDDAMAGSPPPAGGKPVDSYSLEMYFDAFIRKLNRSAAFVRNDPRPRGYRKAQVEISLNADGTLKSFRVLRSADQAAEIAYVRSVLDRAAPFAAFPPDIRSATNSLVMLMCIYPGRAGEGGGFARSAGAADCHD